jgi:hypothetical protein
MRRKIWKKTKTEFQQMISFEKNVETDLSLFFFNLKDKNYRIFETLHHTNFQKAKIHFIH